MKSTLEPELIYQAFERHGFALLRIDRFDRGNYAELRIESPYEGYMTVEDLQDLTNRLRVVELDEEVDIKIIYIDTRHRTVRVNFCLRMSNEDSKLGITEHEL